MLNQPIVTSAAAGTPQPVVASRIALAKPPQFHIKNKVILIGRLGQNAEAKTAQNNREYVVLNIATQESWKNDKGDYETRTEWHRVYLKLAQWLRGDGLMREHVAVLRLSARTHEEHDEEARDLESCFVSVIFFDQGEREVNAGCDTCRCVDRAVAQIDRLGPHNDFWVFLGETVAEVPVRNGLLPVKETRFCEKECAGTNGCDAT